MDETDDEDADIKKGVPIKRVSTMTENSINDLFSLRRRSTIVDDRYKAIMAKKRSIILSNVPEELVIENDLKKQLRVHRNR